METVEHNGKKYEFIKGLGCNGCDAEDWCGEGLDTPCAINGSLFYQLRLIKPKTVTIEGVEYELVKGHGCMCSGCDFTGERGGCCTVTHVGGCGICTPVNNNGVDMILKRVKPAENELTGKQHGDINDAINYTLRSVLNIIELKKLAKNKENKAIKADLDRLTKENEALKAENKELKDKINGKNKIFLWFSDKPVKNSIEFDMRIEKLMSENEELKHHIRKINADTRDLRKRSNF